MEPLPPLQRWACCVSSTLNGASKASRSSEPRNKTWNKMNTAIWKKRAWVQLNDEMRIKEPRWRQAPLHPQLKSASWLHTWGWLLEGDLPGGCQIWDRGPIPKQTQPFHVLRPEESTSSTIPSHFGGESVENSALLLTISILSCANSRFRNDCINWA